MAQTQSPAVLHWTTENVEAPYRFDYYADALTSALVKMRVECDNPPTFRSEMTIADLGPFAINHQAGSEHRCYQMPQDVARAAERSYFIVVNLSSRWRMMHRGRVRLNPGDAVFGDSALLFDITMDTDYDVINLKLGEGFVRQWMPSPGVLVGKRIPCDAGWGKALTSYVAQLSPQFAVQSPLPLSIVTDHLGALLGLIGNEIGGVAARRTRGDESLRDRVKDLIVQRCTETALTPQDIAETLSVSTRTLHRCLAAFGETFGAVLMSARAQAAVRMLESPLFRRLTLAEIGRRAGFIDASHFARVLRKHCGRKPSQVRAAERARSGTPGEDEQVLQ